MVRNVEAIVGRLAADLLAARDEWVNAFELGGGERRFWILVDLADSTSYRSTFGQRDGYVRGETFLQLCSAAIAPYNQLMMLKEIGDAVLYSGTAMPAVIESMLLIHAVTRTLAHPDSAYDGFSVRAAVSDGVASPLKRGAGVDYLGTAIDRVARLSNHKADSIVLDEGAARAFREAEVRQIYPFLNLGPLSTLPDDAAKGLQSPVRFHALELDHAALLRFEGGFRVWKE